MADQQLAADGARLQGGQLAVAISNRMVRIIAEYTGRGPTKSRTYLHDNVILCMLQDTLTKGERQLAARGEERSVLDTRRTYQRLMREDASLMIEELTGRSVVGMLSDNLAEPDVAAEIFVLSPLNDSEDAPPEGYS